MKLDAITQETVISLNDEPDRWARQPMPYKRGVAQTCLMRDDGLVVYERESLLSPFPVRAVAVFAGDGQFVANGKDASALVRAVGAWRRWRDRSSEDDVRQFLMKGGAFAPSQSQAPGERR